MTPDTYHQRALQLSRAMKLCHDDLSAYASAVALLAVHSAISYNDAVLIKLRGARGKGQDHKQAIAAVRRACADARIEVAGLAHLTKLVSAKSDVSYGDKAVDNERALALSVMAERFQTWAERLLGSH